MSHQAHGPFLPFLGKGFVVSAQPNGPRPSPLAGGQAPAYWQREVARSTARLAALRQTSTWVATLVKVHPTVRDGPLLGDCLAALTNQTPRLTGAQLDELQPQPPLSSWPRNRPEREQEVALANDESANVSLRSGPDTAQRGAHRAKSSAYRPTPTPFQLEQQASRTLPDSLAGETTSAEGLSRSQRRPIGEPLEPKAGALLSVFQDPASPQDWLRDLARRAKRSLRLDGLDMLRISRRSSSTQPWLGELPALAVQWAMPLNGPPASADLLARLADAPVRDSDDPGCEAQPWQRAELAPIEGTEVVVPPTVVSRTGGTSGELESPARIAPQVVAPSLPSLLPSQRVGVPSPPVVASIVQQGARQEEAAAAEDDLNVLAAKIKRILDEEARRYGIDV